MFFANNLEITLGGKLLMDSISFVVNPGDRIGLIGRNGAGKTTLLRLLNGENKPDSGEVEVPSDYSIGFLKQEINIEGDETVRKEASKAFKELNALIDKIQAVEDKIQKFEEFESDDYMDTLDQLHQLNESAGILGIEQVNKSVEQVLMGLGFLREELDKPVSHFSGGWQMRIELAKVLLSNPDLVLLDEPTNHLDIESVQWLESYLKSFKGAIILVSHDRAFLDKVINRTFELVNGKLYHHKGNFSEYEEVKEERKRLMLSERENMMKKISQMERNVERFRAKASKAKFAQSLVKKLDKMENVLPEAEEEDLENIKFAFPEAPPSGKWIFKTYNLGHAYGEKKVLNNINVFFERFDRVAFVGRNGEGKTTLSRIIAKNMEHTEGKAEWGHNVKVGYYAQHQADLIAGNQTVLNVIENAADEKMRPKARSLLGAFLFSGDDVFKKVSVLSGGEKSRLALAKLLLDPVNFLILDEPTNHLDLRSKEVLKKALLAFGGTLIVVSHDRDFLKGLTNKVLEFKNRKVKEHLGDIYEYLEKEKLSDIRELERKDKQQSSKQKVPISDKQSQFFEKKELAKKVKKLKNEFSKQESLITQLEKEQQKTEEKLADPENYNGSSPDPELLKVYGEMKKKIAEAESLWEKLGEEMEDAQNKLNSLENLQ
ncbi:MAG: ABC transporter ATP-binding protein [Chitinophagaceae bacterium]|nr:MAG: ABC transporter ATP-binding protein [Chitinophagaceae bacterium]